MIRHLIRLAALASGPATPTRAYVGRLLDSAGDWVNRGDYYAWDPLAAIALVDSTVVRSTVMPITVELSGKFVRWTHRAAGARTATVAIDADARRFMNVFDEGLGSGRVKPVEPGCDS